YDGDDQKDDASEDPELVPAHRVRTCAYVRRNSHRLEPTTEPGRAGSGSLDARAGASARSGMPNPVPEGRRANCRRSRGTIRLRRRPPLPIAQVAPRQLTPTRAPRARLPRKPGW